MKKVFLALLILGTACSTPLAPKLISKKQAGYVKRASFTTAVKNREPRNKISVLRNDKQKIYYFTDLRGMAGQTVTHRWKYNGKVMAKIKFKVKGQRWRVYSSKWLERRWLGTWTASVVDRSGRTLSTTTFSYAKARGWSKGQVPASAESEESLFVKGARGAQGLYDRVFGDD